MIGLFFLWLAIKEVLYKLVEKKFCAICATVSNTWLILLLLKFLGYSIPLMIVAILMGESVVGLMYTFEKKFKNKYNGILLILKPVIILAGTLFVYSFLVWIYG